MPARPAASRSSKCQARKDRARQRGAAEAENREACQRVRAGKPGIVQPCCVAGMASTMDTMGGMANHHLRATGADFLIIKISADTSAILSAQNNYGALIIFVSAMR